MCAHHCAAAGQWQRWQLARHMHSPSSSTAVRTGDGIVFFLKMETSSSFQSHCEMKTLLYLPLGFLLSLFIIVTTQILTCQKKICPVHIQVVARRKKITFGKSQKIEEQLSEVKWFILCSLSFCNPMSLSDIHSNTLENYSNFRRQAKSDTNKLQGHLTLTTSPV